MIVVLAKDKIRKVLQWMGLHLTTNLKYDHYTTRIIKDALVDGGICVDVGCHKGEVFDDFIKYAPTNAHYGFEPIPAFYNKLKSRYGSQHHIFPYALAAQDGQATFQYVKNAPAYSGLRKRKYDIADPEIIEIPVAIKKLDDIVPKDEIIKLIKIDVEGAELGVLQGGRSTIVRCRPVVLFEFGLGASDAYDTTPQDIYGYFTSAQYNLFPLLQYHKKAAPLDLAALEKSYSLEGEFFYVAIPR